MKKIDSLGIDFGSSTLSIIGYEENGSEPIVFYSTKFGKTNFITAMAKVADSDGGESYTYFDDAYAAPKNAVLVDRLKENLYGDDGDGETEVKLFLKEVIRRIQVEFDKLERDNRETYTFKYVKRICFGHPAYYSPGSVSFYCDSMKKLLGEIFPDAESIVGYPEPVLASVAYNNYRDDIRKTGMEDVILVLDFGGHTLDIAIMKAKRERDGITNLYRYRKPGSIDSNVVAMGKGLTLGICKQIYRSNNVRFDYDVDLAKQAIFATPEEARSLNGIIEIDNVSAGYEKRVARALLGTGKRLVLSYDSTGLTADDDNTVCVGMNCGARNLRLEEFYFTKFSKCIMEYLENSGIERNSINHVLFTGGASKIQPLRDYVCHDIEYWCHSTCDTLCMDRAGKGIVKKFLTGDKLPISSENAVALGAALAAAYPDVSYALNADVREGISVSGDDGDSVPAERYHELLCWIASQMCEDWFDREKCNEGIDIFNIEGVKRK